MDLPTTRGLAHVSVSENQVLSLLLHQVILSLDSFGETLQKTHFCITIMARKSMKDSNPLKMPVPEQRITSYVSSFLCLLPSISVTS